MHFTGTKSSNTIIIVGEWTYCETGTTFWMIDDVMMVNDWYYWSFSGVDRCSLEICIQNLRLSRK